MKKIFLFFISLFLFLPFRAFAGTDPFNIEINLVEQEKQYIIVLNFIPNNNNYTYAPNQAEVYPTKIIFYSDQKLQEYSIPLIYPQAKSKQDPVNPSQIVKVYEQPFKVYGIVDKDFIVKKAEISLLACSAERCQPFKKSFDLSEKKKIQFNDYTEQKELLLLLSEYESKKIPEQQLAIAQIKKNTGTVNNISVISQSTGQNNSSLNNLSAFSIDALQEKAQQQAKIIQDPYQFDVVSYNPSLEVTSIFKALLFGFLAGFILNCMPCVLPIVALKIHGFLGANTEQGIRAFREHNIFFSLGILIWFIVLGMLLGVMGFTWGQLFQEFWIMLFLCCFVFLLSLSLFGLFHLPMLDLRLQDKKQGNEKMQALTSGLFATLLATPCSGPLLGGVLGFSLTQSLPVLLSIFIAMGLGMAFPYLCFAINPSLVRFMPKAGNWLHTMEHFLGFFLIGTSLYLLSILPSSMHFSVLVFLFILAFCAYVWGKWGSIYAQGIKKISLAFILIVCLGIAGNILFTIKEKQEYWVNFNQQEFLADLGEKTLVLKFTADWCPTCKVLEKTVFTQDNMDKLAKENDVTFIYVDMTNYEEDKQKLLTALESVSIPLLAVFPKNSPKQPIIVRDIYTFETVQDVLSKVKE